MPDYSSFKIRDHQLLFHKGFGSGNQYSHFDRSGKMGVDIKISICKTGLLCDIKILEISKFQIKNSIYLRPQPPNVLKSIASNVWWYHMQRLTVGVPQLFSLMWDFCQIFISGLNLRNVSRRAKFVV